MKKKYIVIAMIIFALVLTAIAYFLLPDRVVVQVKTDGTPSNILPKTAAVLIPFGLSLGGAVWFALDGSREKFKSIFLYAIGCIVTVITLLFNM